MGFSFQPNFVLGKLVLLTLSFAFMLARRFLSRIIQLACFVRILLTRGIDRTIINRKWQCWCSCCVLFWKTENCYWASFPLLFNFSGRVWTRWSVFCKCPRGWDYHQEWSGGWCSSMQGNFVRFGSETRNDRNLCTRHH